MNSFKCPNCNLTNWATSVVCKRCGIEFQNSLSMPIEPQTAANYFGEHLNGAPTANLPRPAFTESAPPSGVFHDPHFGQHNYGYQNQNNQYSHYQNQSYRPANFRARNSAELKSGLAIASMVLGILGFLTAIFVVGILFSLVGLVLGVVALIKSNRKPEIYGGTGFAVTGIVLGAVIMLFIPILAAIAIPNLLAARRAANEGSAISTLRTLIEAERKHVQKTRKSECADLKTLGVEDLIDQNLAGGVKNGYRFVVVGAPGGNCEFSAMPTNVSGVSATGIRSFFVSTEDMVIKAGRKNGQAADKSDAPIN